MHPFGLETKTSLEDLFVYFKKCLQHGEWELASACMPQLVNSGCHSENLCGIIKSVICHPYDLKWKSLGSPHKLAWYWLQALEKWTQEKVSATVRQELECLLILEELGSEGIPASLLKELHQVFTDSQSDEMIPDVMRNTNAAVESCLNTLLDKKKARIAQSLALFLQPEESTLQHIFIQNLVKKLKMPETRPDMIEQWEKDIYTILSVMPLHSNINNGQIDALCEGLWVAKQGPLKEERVLSSLLRPQCNILISMYCSTAVILQRDHLLKTGPSPKVDLPEAQKLTLSLCNHKDRPAIWKTIYFECLSSGKHYLEQVLIIALDLIKNEEFALLKDLLHFEFQPLSRLILLLGWTRCRSLNSGQTLLSILHNEQATASDAVLQEFAHILTSQLGMLEWCKNNNPEISTEALLTQLHSLDNHSALYILHSLTPLAQFEEHKILELLKQLPNRQHTSDDTKIIQNLNDTGAQRNIVLFQGFCAMKYALYALCINAHKYSNCSESGQQSEISQEENHQTPTSSEGCEMLFQHSISECQRYLKAVPVVLRLELMENIFSLLFLSSTDLSLPVFKDAKKSKESNPQNSTQERPEEAEKHRTACGNIPLATHHLDLAHLVHGCRGFLVDASAMDGLLRLLKEELDGMSTLAQPDAISVDTELTEGISCSVTSDTFAARLQRLSKRTAEAQWRLQIINSNLNSSDGMESPHQPTRFRFPSLSLGRSKSSSLRRRRRHGRHLMDRENTLEKPNEEVSTSASDGNGGSVSCPDLEVCPCGGRHSWLVPAMLSSPESLLLSCIRRGNFMEAHHVSQMFNLEASSCCGELVFMERYKQVLVELGQVEQKMESQSMSSSSSSSEGLGSIVSSVAGRTRLGSSGRTTLQAIGNAAAAGVAFYSISDIADRLLSTAAHPMPCLEEDYWIRQCPSDDDGLLYSLLEELSPVAMAAFDLACCHCQLWRTSRQLLDTAERRLSTSHEDRGLRVDPKLPHSEGICGFPMVLQQINKIQNHTSTNKSLTKTDSPVDEIFSSPFGCCVQEVLLCSHPTLSEESMSSRLALAQRLENTLHILSTANKGAEGTVGSPLLDLLVEQSRLKQVELDSHPIRSNMKQLLRSLDHLCPFEPDGGLARPDYVRSFLDYVNTLAAVLVRSLGSEDQSAGVKLGNPLLVLLQDPSRLLFHLLFDRQVSPDRVLFLLQQEGLQLSVQEVIVQRCCETLPIWTATSGFDAPIDKDGGFDATTLSLLLQEHARDHLSSFGLLSDGPSDVTPESENSEEDLSTSRSSISSSMLSLASSQPPASNFLITPSALAFLKSHSLLLATLACLSASKGEQARAQKPFFWSGRKELVLDVEQINKEVDSLLNRFPVLRTYINSMVKPILDIPLEKMEEAGLGSFLCGKPLVNLLFSGPQEEMTQSVAAEAFKQALISKDLQRALNLLELYGQGSREEGALRDRLLACAALEEGNNGIGHLFRVQDSLLRAHVALKFLERWPLSSCLELLEFCLNDPHTNPTLQSVLQLRKKELDIYHRMLQLEPPLPMASWQELQVESRTNPAYLFSVILEAKEFALCAQWVELYPVSDQLTLKLTTEHLLHLLEKGITDEAFQLLEGLSDFSVGLNVCEQALDKCPGLSACHFLADYLTLHFERQVSPTRRRHIHALHLGSKVLLALPPAVRHDYFPLLSEPLLMLEQLLMNLKVDWAGMAVGILRSLLVGQEVGFDADDIDKILSKYASKALDFTCAPSQRSRSDSVISLQEGLLLCPAQDNSSSSSSRIESPTGSSNNTPTHMSQSNSTEKDKDCVSLDKKRRTSVKFQPPLQPPSQKDWVPDTQQSVCMVCQRERFTMFNRRHHCRRCGRLVCQACSEKKMTLEGCTEEKARVCDQCFAFFHPESDNEEEPDEVSDSSLSPEDTIDETLQLPEVTHRQIQLCTNSAENQLLRSEFYFEQAPCAPLCMAILSLHSDQKSCGHQLIAHCRTLSRKLNNQEVDACLLTDIMKQLLFRAKLMFVKVGRSQDLALCDSYISKVDVLKILVMANYKYIPSLDDILEASAVARLRNQLLEAEHYKLAVEVSTKSGLDPSGVWQAWGMACLKAGHLSKARERFSRCLKPPVDRNQLNQGPVLLQEIVQHLETRVHHSMAASSSEDILGSLRELEEVLSDSGPIERPDGQMRDRSFHQESLFYLNTYGTHLALISFYMRHECPLEALKYLLNKECPDVVFLEGILQPCLEQGRLGSLVEVLEKLDPILETSSRYLIAACQLVQRRGHFHTLYQLQQFMADHVRAAMTCIRFFTHGASSYHELGENQSWLVKAKDHLKIYLQEQQGRGAGRRKSQVNSFRKTMSAIDVSRHMNTIELQLEVTRFLHRCETVASSKTEQTSTARAKAELPPPPTLFSGSAMKVEVACKVMLGGKNIEEGFGIAYRVIQDFQLEPQSVYTRAGQLLIRQRKYIAVKQLLKCVSESGSATKNDCDSLILSCVFNADKVPADAKELESLILEIKSTESKIKAYLLCSKLRPAYLLAVKLDSSRAGPLVQQVLQAADESKDSVMQNICQQWLSEHLKSPRQQRQSRPNAK